MHKFAVIHKPSGIVCYSTNREISFELGFNYEIVSNSIDFKTVSPNLTFNSYTEITNSINLSDVLVFTKGDDDILTIADNTRAITIPALLLQEACYDVEEVAFGDVCEILEDYGFNEDCTELLARNAVKFFTAVRFLETTETTETTTEEVLEVTETTSGAFKLTDKARQFGVRFIIHHSACGDYDLSADYLCVNEAIVYEAEGAGCSKEEMARVIREYTHADLIKAAHDGYGWPVNLGFVEVETTDNVNTNTIEVVAENLELYESPEFEGEMAFEYKGNEYLLSDFMHTAAAGWYGVMGLSYFLAYYVRIEEDDSITLGCAHW